MEILRCLACLAQMPLDEREWGWKFAIDLYVRNELLESVFILECAQAGGDRGPQAQKPPKLETTNPPAPIFASLRAPLAGNGAPIYRKNPSVALPWASSLAFWLCCVWRAHAGGWFFGTKGGLHTIAKYDQTSDPINPPFHPASFVSAFGWYSSDCAFSTPQLSKISIFVVQRPAIFFTLWGSFRLLCSLPMQLLNAIWFWLCTSFCWYPSGYGALL